MSVTRSQLVYLIEDDAAVRTALSLLLRTVGVTVDEFAGPLPFLDALPRLKPGCLVIDIRMPDLSGLRLQEKLLTAGCNWPVIVMSGHGDIEACRRAFRNGAIDFLSKPIDEQNLLEAIQRGHEQLQAGQRELAQRQASQALLATLTPREMEVLRMISQGHKSREIARTLGISPRTVESHRASLGSKLNTNSTAEMIRILMALEPGP